MAKGEDTSRHPNRQVHRDTPRIAAALEGYLNQKIEDNNFQMLEKNPMLYYTNYQQTPEFYLQEGEGQDLINSYRETRERARNVTPRPGKIESPLPAEAAADAENIRDAIAWYKDQQGIG